MSVIEVKNLKKYFGKTRAVDDISFSVEKGEIFGFLGPNGAGKTTAIRCLMDFVRPTAGRINILGFDANKNSSQIKNKIGYLSGDVRLYDGWTGQEHIQFLESIRGQKSIADKLIEKLNFNPKVKFRFLSSGNKQKLGLILALSFQPELLIMDEPTLGLDPLLQNTIYELLEDFQKKGTTIFMSSHNLAEVDRMCHRVGIIKDSKLIAIEGIRELKEKRMNIVKVTFTSPFNRQDFVFDGIEIQKELTDGLMLGVRGDINFLIKKLSFYNIRELEISHASLEDIFLEFYGTPLRGAEVRRNISDGTRMNNQSGIPRAKEDENQDLMEIPKLEE